MIKFLNEDCFYTMDNLKEKISIIITDIPYGIGFHGKNDPNTNWDKFENNEYIKFLEKFFDKTYRITTENAIMFICIAPTKISEILFCTNKWKFEPKYYYHYCRQKGRGATKKLKSLREDVLCFTKGNPIFRFDELKEQEIFRKETKNPIGYSLDIFTGKRIPQYSCIDKSIYITSPSYNSVGEKMIHSCQKPLLFWTQFIMVSSDKGQVVFDPFMGSGSSGIASMMCDRNYIGCEIDTDMYNKACEWLHKCKTDKKTKDKLEEYIKKHQSSSEKGFKFGFDSRIILPKKCEN